MNNFAILRLDKIKQLFEISKVSRNVSEIYSINSVTNQKIKILNILIFSLVALAIVLNASGNDFILPIYIFRDI